MAGLGFGFDFEDKAVALAFGAFVGGFEGLVLDGPAVVDAEADGDPVARLGGLNGRCRRRFWVGWRSGGIFPGSQWFPPQSGDMRLKMMLAVKFRRVFAPPMSRSQVIHVDYFPFCLIGGELAFLTNSD